jgi:formylglycine-generating enzyme required for sulfatase activity
VHGRSAVDPRFSSAGPPLPIDALRPNGFGLLNVAGNVAEWTLDPWAAEGTIGLRERDGVRLAGDATRRAIRGGSWASEAPDLRSTARAEAQVDLRDRRVGVRASRRL